MRDFIDTQVRLALGGGDALPPLPPRKIVPDPVYIGSPRMAEQLKRGPRIYFVRRGLDGPIKIGFSTNVGKRISGLQVSCAEPLVLLGTVEASRFQERLLHAKFKHLRMHGEWFHPARELLKFIQDGCQLEGPDDILGTVEELKSPENSIQPRSPFAPKTYRFGDGPTLTLRQAEMLFHIQEYTAGAGYPPTLRDLGERMGIRSTNGINDHLAALVRKGRIKRNRMMSRAIVVVKPLDADQLNEVRRLVLEAP